MNCLRALGSAFPNQVLPVRAHSQAGHLPHLLINVIRVCENLRKALLPHPRGVRWRWRQAGPGRCRSFCPRRWGVPLVHEGGPPVLGEGNDRFPHGQRWQRLLSQNQSVYNLTLVG